MLCQSLQREISRFSAFIISISTMIYNPSIIKYHTNNAGYCFDNYKNDNQRSESNDIE